MNIARVAQEKNSAVLDLLLEILVVPIETNQTLVELETVRGKYSDRAYTQIISRIRVSWTDARNYRPTSYEKDRRLPAFDLQSEVQQENLNETTKQFHDADPTFPTLDHSGHSPRRNQGGHPALESNNWAFQEISERPSDRKEIFEQWQVKYTEEVGPEAASLRNLRETFNAAMRYRAQKAAEERKSSRYV